MRTDDVNTTPTMSITVYIMSILFFSFFSDFLAIFALLTIFGNVQRPCKQYPNIVNNSRHHVCSFFLFFSSDFLAIFTSISILGNAHRPCKQLSNNTTPSLFFFLFFFSYFLIWNYNICLIGPFLVFILVTGFQCHSVLVNSGDCSSAITGISKFPGRSEILAGKFHWNGTGIHQNDWNLAGICASLRPPNTVRILFGKTYNKKTISSKISVN